jgi:hypothetical protein
MPDHPTEPPADPPRVALTLFLDTGAHLATPMARADALLIIAEVSHRQAGTATWGNGQAVLRLDHVVMAAIEALPAS